jgi:hypothetical protein
MCKLTAPPCDSVEVLREDVVTPAANQVISLAVVPTLALDPLCVVAAVDMEASGEGSLAQIVQQPATNAVGRIIMLVTARPRP